MMNNELRPAEEAMLELGYDREDMKKPRVGVMNTWADYNPGHLHLKGVAQAVTEGIRPIAALLDTLSRGAFFVWKEG